jgi:hypothetical protein
MDKIKSTSVINCPMCQTDLIDYSIGCNDTQHGYTFYTYLNETNDKRTIGYLIAHAILRKSMEKQLTNLIQMSDKMEMEMESNRLYELFQKLEIKIQRRQEKLDQDMYECPCRCTVS